MRRRRGWLRTIVLTVKTYRMTFESLAHVGEGLKTNGIRPFPMSMYAALVGTYSTCTVPTFKNSRGLLRD